MTEEQRQIHPDICKFIAIIIVTCSHCAQTISGEIWSNFIGGTGIDIAFNMPLFMIMSGWFINLKKIRETNTFKFILSKTYRLIIPTISWYLIYCILTDNRICITNAFLFYWYLTALFASLAIITISAKLIKSDILCTFLSNMVVLVIPYSYFANINFMFPFIWIGFYLRKMFETNKVYISNSTMFVSLSIGLLLMINWSPDKSVYITPLKVLGINTNMLLTYIYRFVIGVTLSVPIIYYVKKIETSNYAYSFAKYGKYTLIIYTFSFIFNELFSRILMHYNLHTNKFIIIDFIAFSSCIVIIAVSKLIYDKTHNKKIASIILLGE